MAWSGGPEALTDPWPRGAVPELEQGAVGCVLLLVVAWPSCAKWEIAVAVVDVEQWRQLIVLEALGSTAMTRAARGSIRNPTYIHIYIYIYAVVYIYICTRSIYLSVYLSIKLSIYLCVCSLPKARMAERLRPTCRALAAPDRKRRCCEGNAQGGTSGGESWYKPAFASENVSSTCRNPRSLRSLMEEMRLDGGVSSALQ